MDKITLLYCVLSILKLCVIESAKVNGGGIGNGYIAGGQDAEPDMAPYQVSIQTHPGDHMCGGVIVSERWILTAGHCVVGWLEERLRIATGTHNYREPGALYYIDQIHSHCRYYVPRYHNDLALLHLNTSIRFDEQTQPISLAIHHPAPNDLLLFTGWGAKRVWDEPTERLQQLSPHYISLDACATMLQDVPDVMLVSSHVCSFLEAGKGACNGDNGGPLVSNNTLVGVQIWSYMCAQGKPDIYANVFYYREWIRRTMSGKVHCERL